MAFQGPFDAGSPTTAFFPQAERYGVPVNNMLDSIAAFAATLGVGALFWQPMANRYGKSPIYFISGVVATLGALGCALANDLNSFIGCRVSGHPDLLNVKY
jgi:MFS family permease